MSLDSDIDVLSKVDLFAGFEPDQLRLIAFGAERQDWSAGSELFIPGDEAKGGLVVARGTIELRNGDDQMLASFSVGSLIGEMALITPTKRTARAVAATDTTVIKVSRSLFKRMLEEYPELALDLHARISVSVEEFLDRLSPVQRRLDAS